MEYIFIHAVFFLGMHAVITLFRISYLRNLTLGNLMRSGNKSTRPKPKRMGLTRIKLER